jgi:hypothetical protein
VAITTSQILSRFEGVIEQTAISPRPFRKASTRLELPRLAEGGADGTYRVEVTQTRTLRQAFGTSEVMRSASSVAIDLTYARGGGATGNRNAVLRRVMNDLFALVAACEDSGTYDEGQTGIQLVRFVEMKRQADLPRKEIWRILFAVDWTAALVLS